MKILGAAYTVHDQSVCLIEDGEIKYHLEIERFNRRKHNWINNNEKNRRKVNKDFEIFASKIIRKEKPDIIATSGMGYKSDNGLILPRGYPMKEKMDNQKITHFFDYSLYKNIYYVDHHIAHAAYSYFTSPFVESDILAYDGGGERFQTIFFDKNFKLFDYGPRAEGKRLALGTLWGPAATYSFGKFAAGKLMGLSAYGEIENKYIKSFIHYSTPEMENAVDWNELEELKNFSASLQHFSNMETLAFLAHNKTSNNLCIGGGIGLNGYINQLIDEEIYDNVFIPPATSDCGISIGAALHALWTFEGKRPINKNLAYLGTEYKIPKIGTEYSYEDLYTLIAQKISEGKVVGWYQGRSESGPRALGNRSILADPRDPNMKDHINKSVKHREWFRPFAPAILKEYVTDWFEGIKEARYMLKIAKYKEGMGEKVPAVCHVDYTGRLQTVTKEDNEHFYNLIKAFYDRTGIPMLLNTSFNDNTEPIVETPENALRTFRKNDVDILVLGNRVISK